MANKVSIFGGEKYKKESKKIKSLAGRLLRILRKKNAAFEVCLVPNQFIKRINFRFKGKNQATNILSFEATSDVFRPDLGKNTLFLGEIFLAPDFIRAKNQNIEFLFIHGFLHLLGYTHKEKRDRIRMEKREKSLSRRLKINFYV